MSFFDEARAIEAMMKNRRLSRKEIAKMMGVSPSCVSNKLRLLAYDSAEQKSFEAAGLTERHARALLRLDNPKRAELLDRICKEKPSVALTEAMVDMALTQNAPKRIGKADKLSAIDCFTDSLKASINALRSLEIDAKQTINYYGDKLYITLSISEK